MPASSGCLDAPRSILWGIRRTVGGTDRTFALGGCTSPHTDLAVYLSLPEVDINQYGISVPFLSNDLQRYVYARTDRSTPVTSPTDLMIAPSDDVSFSPTSIAVSPASASGSAPLTTVGWSPDDSQVYYLCDDNTANKFMQFRRVDADGTNDTLILSTTIKDFASGAAPRISHDGTKIAYLIDTDDSTRKGIWVMNSDGTGNTRIRAFGAVFASPLDFYGWSRDDAWLLFQYQQGSPAVRHTTIIRPDGTDETDIFADTAGSNLFSMTPLWSQHSLFLPDGSAVAVKSSDFLNTSPPTPGLLATDGSESFTAFPIVDGLFSGPVLNYNGTRGVWVEGVGGASQRVVSCLTDGSDYRIEDDMTSSAGTPPHDDFVFNGFYINLA